MTAATATSGAAARSRRASLAALLLSSVLTAPWLVALHAQSSPAPLVPAWVAGCWTGATGDEHFSERWSAPDDRTLIGVGFTVKAGRATALDYFRITVRDGRLVYVAQPGGQPPTDFTAVAALASEIVFENLAHDFPKRVGYQRVDATHLTAWIDGGAAGSRRFTFAMHKEPCEP